MLPRINYTIPFTLPNHSQVYSTFFVLFLVHSYPRDQLPWLRFFMVFVGPSYKISPADPPFTPIPIYYSCHPTIQAPDSFDNKNTCIRARHYKISHQNAHISGRVSEEVYKAYKLEHTAKNWVKNNTAHCCTKEAATYHIAMWVHKPYTGCPRRNVPDFRSVFLMLKYTDITQNTYIQSWTVTEIMAREKWGLLAVQNTATCTADTSRDNANVLDSEMQCSLCLRDALRSQSCYVTAALSHV